MLAKQKREKKAPPRISWLAAEMLHTTNGCITVVSVCSQLAVSSQVSEIEDGSFLSPSSYLDIVCDSRILTINEQLLSPSTYLLPTRERGCLRVSFCLHLFQSFKARLYYCSFSHASSKAPVPFFLCPLSLERFRIHFYACLALLLRNKLNMK